MAVVVTEMDMPKGCTSCRFLVLDITFGFNGCSAYPNSFGSYYSPCFMDKEKDFRFEWCPLKPVKSKKQKEAK